MMEAIGCLIVILTLLEMTRYFASIIEVVSYANSNTLGVMLSSVLICNIKLLLFLNFTFQIR
jgi:hypothetical protein